MRQAWKWGYKNYTFSYTMIVFPLTVKCVATKPGLFTTRRGAVVLSKPVKEVEIGWGTQLLQIIGTF